MLNLPLNNAGNPAPGSFPYQVNVTGETTYTFEILLADLGIVDITNSCPLTLYVVTHAEVSITDDSKRRVYKRSVIHP